MQWYNAIADGYDTLYGEEQLEKARIIAENLSWKQTDMLLDVGCGTALTSKVFDCVVIGIEPSELVKQAPISAVLGFGEFLPFKDKSFDKVVAITCVHNFFNIQAGLHEMKRVAKEDVVITVLKNSVKRDYLENLINKIFSVSKIIDSDKDLIYFCKANI